MPARDPRPLSDAELAREIAARPADAGVYEAELCRRFAPRVRLYGLRHLRSPDAADDLVQRVLLLTLKKLRDGEVRELDRVAAFMLGAARMMSRAERGAERFAPLEDVPEELLQVERSDSDPRLSERLASCVEALAERERAVVVMSFVQGQGSEQIGAALGMRPTHVRVARHRALSRLRDCLGWQVEEGA